MSIENVAGIDVACKTLELVVRKRGKNLKVRTFKNEPEGHAALVKSLKKHKVTHVCLEATGSYHLDIAVAISDQDGIEVIVLNPRASKHFAEALMTRCKTDAIDADVLAQYVERMDFEAWEPPSKEVLIVRACSRRLAALTKDKARAKNQLHALQATEQTPDFIIEDAMRSIAQLEQQIQDLEKHALS